MTSIDDVLTDPDPRDPERGDGAPVRNKKRIILAAVFFLALQAGAVVIAVQIRSRGPEPVTHSFIVPAGTAKQIARGQSIDVLPPTIYAHVGDRLVIQNEDSVDFAVGPYTVRSGETLKQVFRRPGAITGECSISSTSGITIVVS